MSEARFPGCRVHPTALVEPEVELGEGTAVWDGVHIRHGARIGRHCIVGEKTYLAYDVRVGDYCKLNASVYVCAGVELGSYVMVSAHTVFTNDLYPRAFDRTLEGLATSEPTAETLRTRVDDGVTIGANTTIGPGLRLGRFAMVGMGCVVTRDVPAHALVVGNPGRLAGWVCACGPLLARRAVWDDADHDARFPCRRCGRVYAKRVDGPLEVEGPAVDDASHASSEALSGASPDAPSDPSSSGP